MKTIENKQTQILKDKESGKATYADLIGIVINAPQQGGYDLNDIESRLSIKKVCDSANGTIELEDGHFRYLKTLVSKARWQILHEDVLSFVADINAVK